jgi:hypothetical protein
LDRANDLVGYRLVCNNLEDVKRARDLLEQSLTKKAISVAPQDYIRRPKPTGYRAIHLNVRIPVSLDGDTQEINCEVQLRSLLQDGWARLSRADIYTAERSLSRPVLRGAKRLAELLSVADQIAQDLREEITRPRRGRHSAKGAPLTAASAAFVFRRAFGNDPPDYLIQLVLREHGSSPVRADAIDAALQDKSLLARLAAAYKKHFDWNPDPTRLFRWAVEAAIRGIDAAKRLAEKEGKEDWAEVDAIARSELLSDLPSTSEAALESIQYPDKDEDIGHDILRWADALDALNECYICGTDIVDAEALADALVRRYKLRGQKAEDAREELEQAIRNSGVEVGGWRSSSICAYHDYQLSKDD